MSLELFEFGSDVKAKITVVGVGGGGGNAINNMINSGLEGVTFITANTDAQALCDSKADIRIQIGQKLTKGLGAGANPRIGSEAALESLDNIKEALADSDMIFVTAGMGGGTGTGAAPIIAKAAKDLGILTVGVVTKPFFFEGKKRMESAEAGIAEFRQHVDSLITIPNDRLLQLAPKKATFVEMLKKADDVLYYAVKGISDLMLVRGIINLDFADVRTVMAESGLAMMGTGMASGESRAKEAAMKAITSPLLEGVSIDGARQVLVNITCGEDLTIDEVSEAVSTVQEAAHSEVNVIFGAVCDNIAEGELRITVIATGIDQNMPQMGSPAKTSVVTPMRHANNSPQAHQTQQSHQGLHTVDKTLQQAVGRSGAEQSNYAVPAYLRKQAPVVATPARSMGHAPGEDDFIFGEDDDFETPSFIRKQAN